MPLPDLSPALRVERALERTALGGAFVARTPESGHVTAIVLARDLATLAPDRERLAAALLARVAPAPHGAVLPLLDVVRAPDGAIVLVLPLEERPPASVRLDRGKWYATTDVASAARELGTALRAAHESGAIHGAIFPGLVYLEGGTPRLAMLGVLDAFIEAGADRSAVLGLLGARTFAAPEVAHGPGGVAGDLYALGATLYACLTGKPPFGGRTTSLVMAAVLADESLTGEVAPALRGDAAVAAAVEAERLTTALLRAVERAPEDRWHSARDFVAAVEGRTPTPAPTPAVGSPAAKRGCMSSLVLVAGAAAALAAGIACTVREVRDDSARASGTTRDTTRDTTRPAADTGAGPSAPGVPLSIAHQAERDLTGDGRAETVRVEAKGATWTTLQVRMTIADADGRELYAHAWTSDRYFQYTPPESDSADRRLVERRLAAIVRDSAFIMPRITGPGGRLIEVDTNAVRYHLAEYAALERRDPSRRDERVIVTEEDARAVPTALVMETVADVRRMTPFTYFAGGEETYTVRWSAKRRRFIRTFACC